MVQPEDQPIVVAIDGTQEGLRALDYAVGEAEREGCPLVLVHVLRAHPQLLSVMVAADVEAEADLGRAALAAARVRARGRWPQAAVTDQMPRGRARHELPEAAAGARLLVLGRTPLTGIERLAAGSVGIPVIARSQVPVVSVPCSWAATRGTGIVAAITSEPSSAHVLRTAFEQARATGTPVIAVRAVEPVGAWSDDLPMPPEVFEWERVDAERECTAEVGRWSVEFPDVQVELRVISGTPSHALLPSAADAQLVVVAARRAGELIHPRLGATARTMLAHASCPVLVVPVGRRHLPPQIAIRERSSHPTEAAAPSY